LQFGFLSLGHYRLKKLPESFVYKYTNLAAHVVTMVIMHNLRWLADVSSTFSLPVDFLNVSFQNTLLFCRMLIFMATVASKMR
jgi:hypothetical protein